MWDISYQLDSNVIKMGCYGIKYSIQFGQIIISKGGEISNNIYFRMLLTLDKCLLMLLVSYKPHTNIISSQMLKYPKLTSENSSQLCESAQQWPKVHGNIHDFNPNNVKEMDRVLI